jgi:hypothetical protein
MSLKSRFRVLVVCLTLQMGVFGGVPIRPDEIQALMHQMNQPTVAHILPTEDEGSDDPPTVSHP